MKKTEDKREVIPSEENDQSLSQLHKIEEDRQKTNKEIISFTEKFLLFKSFLNSLSEYQEASKGVTGVLKKEKDELMPGSTDLDFIDMLILREKDEEKAKKLRIQREKIARIEEKSLPSEFVDSFHKTCKDGARVTLSDLHKEHPFDDNLFKATLATIENDEEISQKTVIADIKKSFLNSLQIDKHITGDLSNELEDHIEKTERKDVFSFDQKVGFSTHFRKIEKTIIEGLQAMKQILRETKDKLLDIIADLRNELLHSAPVKKETPERKEDADKEKKVEVSPLASGLEALKKQVVGKANSTEKGNTVNEVTIAGSPLFDKKIQEAVETEKKEDTTEKIVSSLSGKAEMFHSGDIISLPDEIDDNYDDVSGSSMKNF